MKHMYYIKGDKISRGTLRAMLEQIQAQVKGCGGVYVTLHSKIDPKPKRHKRDASRSRTDKVIDAVTGYSRYATPNKTQNLTIKTLETILA